MQVIYGPNASNILITAQKRLIRPVYAQTQGFPYAAFLDPSLRTTSGNILAPLSTDSSAGSITNGRAAPNPLAYSANTFTYMGSIVPATVAVKSGYASGGAGGEYACVHNGVTTVQPWGLLDQWLGGTFDNVGQNNQIGVWMGPDSTYEILAPGWNDTGLATAVSGGAAGANINLAAGTDGRLVSTSVTNGVPVCRVIDRIAGSRIVVQLVI